MKRETINPPGAPKPFRPTYSNAVVVEAKKLVFVSGQLSLDKDGNLIGKGDIVAQTRQVLENLKTILKGAGASMENVIKLTIFMTDLSQYEEVGKVRSKYFRKEPPASTLVQVSSLVKPDFLIEIEAVAAVS